MGNLKEIQLAVIHHIYTMLLEAKECVILFKTGVAGYQTTLLVMHKGTCYIYQGHNEPYYIFDINCEMEDDDLLKVFGTIQNQIDRSFLKEISEDTIDEYNRFITIVTPAEDNLNIIVSYIEAFKKFYEKTGTYKAKIREYVAAHPVEREIITDAPSWSGNYIKTAELNRDVDAGLYDRIVATIDEKVDRWIVDRVSLINKLCLKLICNTLKLPLKDLPALTKAYKNLNQSTIDFDFVSKEICLSYDMYETWLVKVGIYKPLTPDTAIPITTTEVIEEDEHYSEYEKAVLVLREYSPYKIYYIRTSHDIIYISYYGSIYKLEYNRYAGTIIVLGDVDQYSYFTQCSEEECPFYLNEKTKEFFNLVVSSYHHDLE